MKVKYFSKTHVLLGNQGSHPNPLPCAGEVTFFYRPKIHID